MRIVRWVVTGMVLAGLAGCTTLFGGYEGRRQASSSTLVNFLYANQEVPPVEAEVRLQLPIRVGVSFLPTKGPAGPSPADREQVLASIRENFRTLPYVSEIVPIPDYYLLSGAGNGFTQIEQLSRLHRLDLFALVSWDQITDSSQNRNSLAYWTIVGAYFVRGDRHETHTLLDLAVIDPVTRSLVLRAGGTSSLGGNTTLIDADKHELAQRARGFELATASLVGNFKRELTAFETRVREGTAPVRVVRGAPAGGGTGALDVLLLAVLAGLSLRGARAWRGTRSSASARW
jgi:rhombotail lipoprotein